MRGPAPSLRDLRAHRGHLNDVVASLPNVVGSMIGKKIVNGDTTDETSFTVFVRKKLSLSQIGKHHRIPGAIRIAHRSVPSDVLEIGPLRKQSRFEVSGGLPTFDELQPGTMTAYCRSSKGLFGMGAAHALTGVDRDPLTPTAVSVWSPTERRYIRVGNTTMAAYDYGFGIPGDYGFADVAIFTLVESELLARAKASRRRPPRGAALLSRVYGESAHGALQGEIIGVDQTVRNVRADVCIRVNTGGTFPGDSGLLWRSEDGSPIAIHAYGADDGPHRGSTLTAAMSAVRAEKRLDVEILS